MGSLGRKKKPSMVDDARLRAGWRWMRDRIKIGGQDISDDAFTASQRCFAPQGDEGDYAGR